MLEVIGRAALFVVFCIVIPWALVVGAVWGLWSLLT